MPKLKFDISFKLYLKESFLEIISFDLGRKLLRRLEVLLTDQPNSFQKYFLDSKNQKQLLENSVKLTHASESVLKLY